MPLFRSVRSVLVISLLFLIIAALIIVSHRKPLARSVDLELLPLHTRSGWGYRILVNHRPFLYQPYIPVLSGQKPFANEAQAMRTGAYVIQKLKEGQRPILTLRDLDTLGLAKDSI